MNRQWKWNEVWEKEVKEQNKVAFKIPARPPKPSRKRKKKSDTEETDAAIEVPRKIFTRPTEEYLRKLVERRKRTLVEESEAEEAVQEVGLLSLGPTLDAILAVEGGDGVFIGPSDLAADMGHRGESGVAEVQAAIRDALGRIAASEKAAGILALDPETAARYRDWGAQFLAVGIDVLLLAQAARDLAARWRDG